MEIFFNNGSMTMTFHILQKMGGVRNLGTEKSDLHRKKNKL